MFSTLDIYFVMNLVEMWFQRKTSLHFICSNVSAVTVTICNLQKVILAAYLEVDFVRNVTMLMDRTFPELPTLFNAKR